ncbi:MAG: hypothetical protein KA712_23560 [Myxococcales bacterium]|nr:hypothetical protein [Myxococcales bacterium]
MKKTAKATPTKEEAESDEKVRAYMLAAVDTLRGGKTEVLDALERISAYMKRHAPDRLLATQLLAVRKYLRSKRRGANLEAIWSWTDADIDAQKKLEPTKSLYEEAAKVQANFKKANPDYHLVLSPVRSLEAQVRLWGRNSTVGEAGAKLLAEMKEVLSSDQYPAAPTTAKSFDFAEALRQKKSLTGANKRCSRHVRSRARQGSRLRRDERDRHRGAHPLFRRSTDLEEGRVGRQARCCL